MCSDLLCINLIKYNAGVDGVVSEKTFRHFGFCVLHNYTISMFHTSGMDIGAVEWVTSDIEVKVKETHDDPSLIHQIGVIRNISVSSLDRFSLRLCNTLTARDVTQWSSS